MSDVRSPARVGIALGGGSARGWAHIGVLSALAEHGIEPEFVCGTSIGALVGGIHSAGKRGELEAWVGDLTRREVLGLADFTVAGGGVIGGRRLLDLYHEHVGEPSIEELPRRFAAVATDLESGAEVWLENGPLHEAIRASISLPGLFTPVRWNGRWLVDGGLVNPVPVSLCRAMGAELVIAVDLRGGAPIGPPVSAEPTRAETEDAPAPPRFAHVIAASFDIMQERITRSQLAGTPPDLLLLPRVRDVPPLEFAGGRSTIEEGYAVVRRSLPELRKLLGLVEAE